MSETSVAAPTGRNPIRRFATWLGWSEDQYLTALGYLPLVAAFVAGVVLSYTSLTDLASWLGYGRFERPFFPFAIDALVFGCYIAQARLAGIKGFGLHRLYIVILGGIAVALTGAGNAMHGLIVWKLLALPLPWPILVLGSIVPAIAMGGVGHAFAIMRAAGRHRAVQGDGHLTDRLSRSDASGAVQPDALEGALGGPVAVQGDAQRDVQVDRQLSGTDPVTLTRRLTGGKQSAAVQSIGHPAVQADAQEPGQGAVQPDGQADAQAARQPPVTKGRITAAKNRQLRRAGLIVAQEPDITGADLGRRLKVSAATGQRILRDLAEQESPPLALVSEEHA